MKVTRVKAAVVLLFLLPASAAAADKAKATSPVYAIPRMEKIAIDGKADDWGEGGLRVDLLIPPAGKPKSVADHDASFRLGWNDKGLLVLVSVHDDKWVEHKDQGWLWRYDGVELFLGDKPGADICQWAIPPTRGG